MQLRPDIRAQDPLIKAIDEAIAEYNRRIDSGLVCGPDMATVIAGHLREKGLVK